MNRKLLALPVAAMLALAGVACGGDDDDSVGDRIEQGAEDARDDVEDRIDDMTDDAAEAAARTLAARAGADEFAAADHPIDGELTCEAEVGSGTDDIAITCTGTTEDGDDAELTGITSETPGASATTLEGDFAGTVAGDEVFTTDRLGDDDGGSGSDDEPTTTS